MFCNASIGFPCLYPDLGSVTDCMNVVLANQKHYQDLGRVASSD